MGPRRRRRGSPRVCRVPRAGGQAPGAPGTLAAPPARGGAEAWREGDIGLRCGPAIAAARRHRTEASMARDEEMLVAQAAELGSRTSPGGLVLLEAAG